MRNHQRLQSTQNVSRKRQWWKLLIWGILFGGGYYYYDNFSYQSAINESVVDQENAIEKSETFIVSHGNSPRDIADSLEKKHFISSASYFLRYLKEHNLDSQLYSGKYELSNTMTLSEIAKKLTTKAEFIKILIPEGLTISEIDERLASHHIFEKGEFEKCVLQSCTFSQFDFIASFTPLQKRSYLEGYFFPATYKMKKSDLTPQRFANKMLETFEIRAKKLGIIDGFNGKTLHEIVTMASIIEKESSTHTGTEPMMISGILWNRIQKHIPLGADATLRYILQKDSSALTQGELQNDNSFNTRKYKGLPPHAIANPGEDSLKAAITPADTKYLFYLHDKNQKIHYAITNIQHEKNKRIFCGGSCE